MNIQSDQQLLQQLKAGSSRAYDAIFLKYYKLLCINAYFYLHDEQEAKDLVQAFFLELWEKKIYMRLEGDIKGYLYRSIQNRCLNYLRKQETNTKKQSELVSDLETEYIFEEEDSLEAVYAMLNGAFSELPNQRKEALKLVYFQDKKYQEAADIMGISINSLKTHLKIGLKNLREMLNIF
ncbi:sigma-70 family RNA polymerase sigma factor [Pedobacter sp. BS3]|uniref:sigma-70 family RNA polymerase sigma factor n=1 Tax=Pedobacter sp. BS3 TaxID=2567937 RepID=UPI0011EE29CA|nr:sigma-70 family RNA polymerase sigma factor [Pedobacter sp. BS3]TZF81098.1 sigma-70 family RNA polymerase sigma factor [Pedobacter sp. BS3]